MDPDGGGNTVQLGKRESLADDPKSWHSVIFEKKIGRLLRGCAK